MLQQPTDDGPKAKHDPSEQGSVVGGRRSSRPTLTCVKAKELQQGAVCFAAVASRAKRLMQNVTGPASLRGARPARKP